MKTQSNFKSTGVFSKLALAAVLIVSLSTACEKVELTPPEQTDKEVVNATRIGNTAEDGSDLSVNSGEFVDDGNHHPL